MFLYLGRVWLDIKYVIYDLNKDYFVSPEKLPNGRHKTVRYLKDAEIFTAEQAQSLLNSLPSEERAMYKIKEYNLACKNESEAFE